MGYFDEEILDAKRELERLKHTALETGIYAEFSVNRGRGVNMSIFDKHGYWLFGNDGTMDEELQEEEHQEELCRLMEMYQAYRGSVKKQSYVLRGSVINCQYGTQPVLLDVYEDYGVVWGRFRRPVMTCFDCMPNNIYHFGSCLCPESNYSGRLPMTVASLSDGKTAIKAKENIFPHICVPLINVDQGWRQIDGDVLIDAGQKGYAPMLLDDAVLVCQYGGIIRVLEVEGEFDEKERTELYIAPWLKVYEGEPDTSDGTIVTYSFEDRSKLKEIRNSIDWYSYESQSKKNKHCEPYLVGQDFIDQGDGVLVDQNGRYWVTLGPKVFYPEYPDYGKCEATEFLEFIGCRIDVVLRHKEDENNYIYIECVWSGNIKAHTFNNGIYQTGIPYPESYSAKAEPYDESYVNGSIIEFTGMNPKNNGQMSEYIVEYLIVYP